MKQLNREDIVKNIKHKYLVLVPNGEEIWLDLNDKDNAIRELEKIGNKELLDYVCSEELKGFVRDEAPSIKEMKRLELFDDEPSADKGNHIVYPNGQLMMKLVQDWQEKIAKNDLGAMEIGSPLFYDKNDPEIKEQAGSFHERHYVVKAPDSEDGDKEFILRFAGDFGLFKMMHKANFSYRQLPVRMFESSENFRYEKSGELAGLRRDRYFHMADVHCFCRDEKMAKDELSLIYNQYEKMYNGLGFAYCNVLRSVDEFYLNNKQMILDLIKISNKPIFIELLSQMKHYWAMKFEWQSIDSVNGNQQLSTIQLDVKEGKVYDIGFVNEKGLREHCVIIHSSIGAVERCIYALLEEALKLKQPVLPLWISPVQMRIIPVNNDAHLEYCKQLSFAGIRYDIDDRNESLGKKLVRARQEWIPYVIVVGQKEIESNKYNVNDRYKDSQKQMNKDEIESMIKSQINNFPYREINLPKLLSRRLNFYGAL